MVILLMIILSNIYIGLIDRKVFESRDQVADRWLQYLPFGYPIPTLNRNSELLRVNTILESNHIYSRGRFGSWKYETSNQDHCFTMGCEFIDRLLSNTHESVHNDA